MLVNTEDLKNITDKILAAVDSSEISSITANLEMYVEDCNLYICVTNREYFVKAKYFLGYSEDFHATVNASTFLKLIAQITTEDIELTSDKSALHIKGNGNYKLNLIYDGEKLLTLPRIDIENPTCSMHIESSILQSILKYNSKEIQKGFAGRDVQKMYYMDEQGAITFTTGACVNKFTLEKPVRVLLSGKVVKLFKLFKDDEIAFTLGYDPVSNSIIQTKVRFEDSNTQITAILRCDDVMLKSVPVKTIRGRVDADYPYSVSFNKAALLQAINRMSVFMDKKAASNYVKLTFASNRLVIEDKAGNNREEVPYDNTCDNLLHISEAEYYSDYFDLNDLKLTLQICDESHLTIKCGDGEALVIARTNIFNIIPKCVMYSQE